MKRPCLLRQQLQVLCLRRPLRRRRSPSLTAGRSVAGFAPAYIWHGPYLGANVGYRLGHSDWTATFRHRYRPVVVGGIQGGYNWQTGPLVFGLEGDIAWANIKRQLHQRACPTGCEIKNTWLGTAAAASATRSTASCPMSPAALAFGEVKATHERRRQRERHQCRLDRRRRHRGRDRRQLDRQARISLCRSRRHHLQRAAAAWRAMSTSARNVVRAGLNCASDHGRKARLEPRTRPGRCFSRARRLLRPRILFSIS